MTWWERDHYKFVDLYKVKSKWKADIYKSENDFHLRKLEDQITSSTMTKLKELIIKKYNLWDEKAQIEKCVFSRREHLDI